MGRRREMGTSGETKVYRVVLESTDDGPNGPGPVLDWLRRPRIFGPYATLGAAKGQATQWISKYVKPKVQESTVVWTDVPE